MKFYIIAFYEKPLLYAAIENNKNIEVIRLLLSRNEIEVNKKYIHIYGINKTIEKTPLHLAFEKEYIAIIKLLLEHKNINVDAKNDQGKKPIECTSNNEIKKLLNHI